MQDFTAGAFEFMGSQHVRLAGEPARKWAIWYSHELLNERFLPNVATRSQVQQAFDEDVATFVRQRQSRGVPARVSRDAPALYVQLVTSTGVTGVVGQVLGGFTVEAEIAGLSGGMIDDRYPTWLVTTTQPTQCVPMRGEEFKRLAAAHSAVQQARADAQPAPVAPHRHAWIARVLPDAVLTQDPETWRAPTQWELRHVVGEDSFTGISGAKAAALVGVTPQNFRKYTARDGASTRQNISFAMWHLLLHKLKVQQA